jgi:hypothetical protein
MQRRLSNAVAESGDVSLRKSLQQRHCSRETLGHNGFDIHCDRNRKSEKIRSQFATTALDPVVHAEASMMGGA